MPSMSGQYDQSGRKGVGRGLEGMGVGGGGGLLSIGSAEEFVFVLEFAGFLPSFGGTE